MQRIAYQKHHTFCSTLSVLVRIQADLLKKYAFIALFLRAAPILKLIFIHLGKII